MRRALLAVLLLGTVLASPAAAAVESEPPAPTQPPLDVAIVDRCEPGPGVGVTIGNAGTTERTATIDVDGVSTPVSIPAGETQTTVSAANDGDHVVRVSEDAGVLVELTVTVDCSTPEPTPEPTPVDTAATETPEPEPIPTLPNAGLTRDGTLALALTLLLLGIPMTRVRPRLGD